MNIKSKRTIMGLAALFILIFHFYIPVFKQFPLEKQIASLGFIGVDMFFLVSGMSVRKAGAGRYGEFVLNRFLSVWLPFALFAGVAAIYKKWSIQAYFLNITGVRLFTKGGGAFCWFFPGIMIFYLLAPFFVLVKKKTGMKGLGILITVWLLLVLFLQHGLGYTTVFILLNRLPIFLAGIWFDEFKFFSTKFKWPIVAAGLFGGGYLLYYVSLVIRTAKTFVDAKYVAAIPFVMALTILVDGIASRNKLKIQPLKWLGGFTLELYALQMIFGYNIIALVAKRTGTNIWAFLLTVMILAVTSFALALIKKCIIKLIKKGVTK